MNGNDTEKLFGEITSRIDDSAEQLYDLACKIHKHPELAFQEFQASSYCTELLKNWGFDIKIPYCDLETAFRASYGNGRKKIAFLAEYDALPAIGHACGHNLIAAISLGAAFGLKPYWQDLDIEILVIGTPAEEGGGGKILLLERGGFDQVKLAMLVHPAPVDAVHMNTKALTQFKVEFIGKEAHASSAPYEGKNALDAMVVALTSIGLLRQQLPVGNQVHGIITDGGSAPNVIPSKSGAHYIIRSDTLDELNQLEKRVLNCFKAGALATDTELRIEPIGKAYSHFKTNNILLDLLAQLAAHPLIGRNAVTDKTKWFSASTDMANLSWVFPCVHPTIAVECNQSVNHQPEFASVCIGPSARKAIVDGAKWISFFAAKAVIDAYI